MGGGDVGRLMWYSMLVFFFFGEGGRSRSYFWVEEEGSCLATTSPSLVTAVSQFFLIGLHFVFWGGAE